MSPGQMKQCSDARMMSAEELREMLERQCNKSGSGSCSNLSACASMMLSSCAGTQAGRRLSPSLDDQAALQEVVGAVAGEEITEQDLRNLVHKARNDEETRSAFEAVSGAMTGEVIIKYCPVDGKRYNARMLECPDHHVPLMIVEE